MAAALALASGAWGCVDEPELMRAFKVEDRADLIGGPGAVGRVGDYVIENGEIRAVILGPREASSAGPGIWEGSLVDLDLVRPEARFQGGRGLDQLAELIPMANLVFPNGGAQSVSIVSDDKDVDEVRVRAIGSGDLLFKALGLLKDDPVRIGPAEIYLADAYGLQTDLCFRTDYVMRPGERLIEISTTVTLRPPTPPDFDDEDPKDICLFATDEGVSAAMEPADPEVPINAFGTLLGDGLAEPPGFDPRNKWLPGVVGGDFIYFGHTTSVFGAGMGFDTSGSFQRLIQSGRDTFSEPLGVPYLVGVGDGVSYALGSAEGATYVPIFAASATAALTAIARCKEHPDEGDLCNTVRHWTYTRYMAVGEGDVASAAEPLMRLREERVREQWEREQEAKPPLQREKDAPRRAARLRGTVIDGRTGEPLPRARVFVVSRPVGGAPGASYDEIAGDNRGPDGSDLPGLVTEIQADLGHDVHLDGGFEGLVRVPLPGEELLAFTYVPGRGPSTPIPLVFTEAGGLRPMSLTSPAPGRLDHLVLDEWGEPVPAKLTIVPLSGAALARPELGDSRHADGVYHVEFSLSGRGTITLPAPGRYRVLVSRGFEHELHVEEIDVEPARTSLLRAVLIRSVDTSGWISADLHVHALPSYDSGVSLPERAITMAAEGVEWMVSTDHDVISDYGPVIRELALERHLAAEIGVETTPIELGHYLGFPLDYSYDAYPNGGAPDWAGQTPGGIVESLRAAGRRAPAKTVVAIPHPRDGFFGYFDQIGLSPYTLDGGGGAGGEVDFRPTLEQSNPLLEVASCDFDAMEILNGKRYELIRTPTVEEAVHYEIKKRRACCDPSAVASEFVRRILSRTNAEQEAWFDSTEPADCSARDFLEPEDQEPCDCDAPLPEIPEERCPDCPCADHEGVVDDWFRLLNASKPGAVGSAARGAPDHSSLRATTGLANSDTHGKTDVEAGFPRNWIASATDLPFRARPDDLVDAVLDRRVTGGAGPFLEMWVNGAPIGSVIRADGEVGVRVRLQSPSWFSVTRVELYRNGHLVKVATADDDDWERVGAVDFEHTWTFDSGAEHVWYVALAMGLDPEASPLGPVYTSVPFPPVQFDAVASTAFSKVPIAAAFLGTGTSVPAFGPSWPYAFTNPIWVIGDGAEEWRPTGVPHFCQGTTAAGE